MRNITVRRFGNVKFTSIMYLRERKYFWRIIYWLVTFYESFIGVGDLSGPPV